MRHTGRSCVSPRRKTTTHYHPIAPFHADRHRPAGFTICPMKAFDGRSPPGQRVSTRLAELSAPGGDSSNGTAGRRRGHKHMGCSVQASLEHSLTQNAITDPTTSTRPLGGLKARPVTCRERRISAAASGKALKRGTSLRVPPPSPKALQAIGRACRTG